LGPVNASGSNYVAYLFAHDAGGFGDDGEQNVVSCGSYTGNGSTTGPVVTLGYEPQWLLLKAASASGDDWFLVDNMRGFNVSDTTAHLSPNTSAQEFTTDAIQPTATGFKLVKTYGAWNSNGVTYIYIAIRRGPMKTPTAGTEVFALQAPANTNIYTSGFPVDLLIRGRTDGSADNAQVWSRITGASPFLLTSSTNAENSSAINFDSNTRVIGGSSDANNTYRMPWMFRRAPGCMDVVCWTGDDVAGRNVNHNLGVTPELIWVKRRNSPANHWYTYHTGMTGGVDALHSTARLNLTEAGFDTQTWKNYSFTSTTFSIDNGAATNASGGTYIAYLFATLAGISKVGSYTGTGTTLQVDCGFSAGARFVMIKRTDNTSAWFVWDTARGIIAGNDPYLRLNSTAAQITNTDYIDPLASGFEITSTAPSDINESGGTFIFLAIA
jgi:hypothetical protein